MRPPTAAPIRGKRAQRKRNKQTQFPQPELSFDSFIDVEDARITSDSVRPDAVECCTKTVVEEQVSTDSQKKSRRIPPQVIRSVVDLLTRVDQVLLSIMRMRQVNGRLKASLTDLARAAAEELRKQGRLFTQKQVRTFRRTIFDSRNRLRKYGFITCDEDPTFIEETVYRVQSEENVWSVLRAAGYTHWKNSGRGRTALTAKDVRLLQGNS